MDKLITCLMLLLLLTHLVHAQGDIAPMSINVGFDANGEVMRTDSAALTIWGKTLVLDPAKANTDISPQVDLSAFAEVEDYLLWVEKGALTTWFRYNAIDTWADHVLEDTYELMPLDEVSAFTTSQKHLPGVPSVAELEGLGHFSMKEMDKITLTKIEELTLYLIDQEHTIAQLQKIKELPALAEAEHWLSELENKQLEVTKDKKP